MMPVSPIDVGLVGGRRPGHQHLRLRQQQRLEPVDFGAAAPWLRRAPRFRRGRGLARAHQHDGGEHGETRSSASVSVSAADAPRWRRRSTRFGQRFGGAGRRSRARCTRDCGKEGGEESASPRTRTQPLVRRPDRLRHSGLPQGLGDGVRHTVHESLDFTPTGNRAERVQTVNVKCRKRLLTGALFCVRRCLAMSSTLIRPSAAENVALGLRQRRPHHVVDQRGMRQRRLAGVLGAAGGAQDVFGGDAFVLARQFVAAMRPAHAAAGCRRAPALAGPVRDGGAAACDAPASALADTGRPWALIATSITAAMARMPLRDTSGMVGTTRN